VSLLESCKDTPKKFVIHKKAPPAEAPKPKEAEAKKAHLPKISALPTLLKKGMMNKLSGMEETHEYTLGLGHPTKYILDLIEKYRGQEQYWGKNYQEANSFLKEVAKYANEMSHSASWKGEPQKMILVADWEKIF
jgi:hypothetical protein